MLAKAGFYRNSGGEMALLHYTLPPFFTMCHLFFCFTWFSVIWVRATSTEWEVNKVCGQLFGEAVLVWVILCRVEWMEDAARNIFFSCPGLKLEQTELLWRIKAESWIYSWKLYLVFFLLKGCSDIISWLQTWLEEEWLSGWGTWNWPLRAWSATPQCPVWPLVCYSVSLHLSFPFILKGALSYFWENCEDKYTENFCSVWAFLNGAITERGESWSVGRGSSGRKAKPLPQPLSSWEAFDIYTIQVVF